MSASKKITPDWGKKNWRLAAADIRCKADGVGASVWLFNQRHHVFGPWPSVLAHDEESARAAVGAWLDERQENSKCYVPEDEEVQP
jgi:hypothetical protein